ncbi:MAG: hypothetical protein R3B96_00255 [Pirellulaceae bacterium]
MDASRNNQSSGGERVDALSIGPRVSVLPIIHGSADCASEVRRRLLSGEYDAVAVPLPGSFQAEVEQAILELPRPSLVVQEQGVDWEEPQWREADDEEEIEEGDRAYNYVPIDPSQPVIAALRAAMEEHIPRYFIDLETEHFVPYGQPLPDPYALKQISLEQFCVGVLPAIHRPEEYQRKHRIAAMAKRLRDLSIDHRSVLLVCSILDWPWIREAYFDPKRTDSVPPDAECPRPERRHIDFRTLCFLLGEIPFITSLYEQARKELLDHANLSIDGVKELLLAARNVYREEYGSRARTISPAALKTILKYSRNLTLLDRRLTPELTTLLTAAKQVMGDGFALSVFDVAREYTAATEFAGPKIRMGLGKAVLPERPEAVATMVSLLPGPPMVLHRIDLKPRPDEEKKDQWRKGWSPYGQCSWPPEDARIESFRAVAMNRAKEILGTDLAKTEKFTTSLMEGIDIRETLRRWYDGGLYVKVLPPKRGELDAVVMLFDVDAAVAEYPWRSTWYAEHEEESTLAFYATDHRLNLVGPGISQASYGGALFLFPPRQIPDVWNDPRLAQFTLPEERLLAAAALHSRHRHIALVAEAAPRLSWRRIAKQFRKSLVHVPLAKFSSETVQLLRQVHVLDDKQVRSWADAYIRRP